MPYLRSTLSAVAATCLVALTLGTAVPAAEADTGAAIRITEFAYGGLISGVPGDGEYVELTNVGTAAQDLTGWSYDNVKAVPGAVSLSGLGTVAPGASVIITDVDAASFRAEWGLKDSVKIVNDGTETLNKGPNAIHIYDATGTQVDSLTYGSGFLSAKGLSAWVDAAHLGQNADTTGWTISAAGDSESSWTSAKGAIGSPGASTRGTLTPGDVRSGSTVTPPPAEAPCDTENAGTAPGTIPAGALAWPGAASPVTIDPQCNWVTTLSGQDLSGLAFDPTNANVLYAVKNKSHVYRLVRSGSGWVKDAANGWADGKDIRFPGNTGLPDSEGLTVGPDGALYITTERDNAASGVPLDSVLEFDPAAPGSVLVASDEWMLTSDLAFTAADANLGFEGVTYVPDSFLTASGFRTDDGTLYAPSAYPGKATPGLFFAAVEKTGHLRAYALNADHTWTRVADIPTGLAGVMEVQYDPDLGRLWAHCDNTCGNATALVKLGADGRFAVDRYYATPAGLPNFNLEGFAVAPMSTATGGAREVLWTDDGDRFGHSLWRGTLNVDLGLTQTSTPTPVIEGNAARGGVLTANVGTWDPGVTTHYQWSDGAAVLGADTALTLSDPALVGRTVTLSVTGSRPGFVDATTTATVLVMGPHLSARTPTIGGAAKVGKTLTAHSGPWGPGAVQLAYRWFADGQPIAGATGDSLDLTPALAGAIITVQVTGTSVGYLPTTSTSTATGEVRSKG